mmetsp:Transcript_1840/g.2784  ORF Transcript_1840/g.2784 Transcript_1840/m.2784 type:complete len:308 (-) Transcript_1840:114-1037(-)
MGVRSLSVVLLLGVLLLGCFLAPATADTIPQCGDKCDDDDDCIDSGNFCSFCSDEGVCSPMCGVGCRHDSDCDTGGPNPCTRCHDSQCVNPNPKCGEFCGYGVDAACRVNGTGSCDDNCCTCDSLKGCGNWTTSNCDLSSCSTTSDCENLPGICTTCHNRKCQPQNCNSAVKCSTNDDCTQYPGSCTTCTSEMNCVEPVGPSCGDLCTNSAECTGSSGGCTQCIGYSCSKPEQCGQNCISSGQCQGYNSGTKCTACIGTICQDTLPCGGSCGGDDQCGSSCPVCSFAKCKSSADALQDKLAEYGESA